jgi:Multiubiquitin
MNTNAATDAEDIEDIGAAVREGRPIRPARGYRVAVSDQSLVFRPVTVTDPVPLGRQILEAAGVQNVEEYGLFAILPSGDFEDVRLDETFDLRGKGAERFVAFRSDRDFRLSLNGHELRWGEPVIAGVALYTLANPPDDQAVYLDTRGGEDRLIEPGDQIDLTQPGMERFVTAARKYEIIVNARKKTVTGSLVTFDQIVQLAYPGSHEPNVVFTMTYRHAASTPPAGELGPGGTVRVKNGTAFNVTRTVQS